MFAVVGVLLVGGAAGAGTFASFSASTSNATSTFATGSVVLKQTGIGGNTCYSNGTSNNGVGTNTDTNANGACSAVFTAGTNKPGDTATQALTLTNDGTIAAASGVKVYKAATNCVDGQSATSNSYYGTGSMCETLQFNLTDTTNTKCLFGGGAAGEVNSSLPVLANAQSTLVVSAASANNTITVNGTLVTVTAGTYGYSMGGVGNQTTTNPTLSTALEDALVSAGVPVMAGVGIDGKVYLASTVPGGALPVITNGTTAVLKGQLNLTSPVTTYAAAQAGACVADPAHTVMNLTKSYTSVSGLPVVSSLNAASSVALSVVLTVDTNAGNLYQGRLATFGLTWFESQ